MRHYQGTETAPLFEHKPCTRCGGSGFFSFCQTYGSTCFKCGYAAGVKGTGVQLTKRGAAAQAYYNTLKPIKLTKDLRPGDVIWDTPGPFGGGWRRVVDIKEASGDDNYDIHTAPQQGQSTGLTFASYPGEGPWRIQWASEPQKDAAIAQALAFQATLTIQGKPRKARARYWSARILINREA